MPGLPGFDGKRVRAAVTRALSERGDGWLRHEEVYEVLAAIGLFGVLSYAMAQRNRELGIRLALGAQRADVLRLVARETVPMVASGVIIGLVAALGLTRFVRSMLYEIQPNDPATFAAVAITLAVVALVAALVPARRASRVDPVIAIRNE